MRSQFQKLQELDWEAQKLQETKELKQQVQEQLQVQLKQGEEELPNPLPDIPPEFILDDLQSIWLQVKTWGDVSVL